MSEKTIKTIKKSLDFEKSGETLSVEIELENVSPNVGTYTIISFLDALYERAKESLRFERTNFDYEGQKNKPSEYLEVKQLINI